MNVTDIFNSGAPWVNESTHQSRDRATERPSDRTSAPQAYQCLLSHFLAALGAHEKAGCTSLLSSIDSCQNRVSADQYHLTVSLAQVSTHQGRVFLKLSADNLLVFKWSQSHVYFFLKFISNMLSLCQYRSALLRFWLCFLNWFKHIRFVKVWGKTGNKKLDLQH